MKKTIGDLTLNQIIKIKDRCSKYKNCKQCKEKDELCYIVCVDVDLIFEDYMLELEFEVEEDEQNKKVL